ncbi:uncharacterized protein [Misgurnus anguillicaudatus]|uniref:uncharacterized protein n=1 Tax=Misgurnus anguillicaudatus TaxID=75329 RepID=UPI003CCF536C
MSTSRDELVKVTDARRLNTNASAAGRMSFSLPGAIPEDECSPPTVVRQNTILSDSAGGHVTGSSASCVQQRLNIAAPAASYTRFTLPGAIEEEEEDECSPEAHRFMAGSGERDAQRRLSVSSSAADQESIVSSEDSEHNTTHTMEQKTKSQKKKEKKRKRKRKGKKAAIRSFFQNTWRTIKQACCVCQNEDDLDPSDPTDPPPGPSGLKPKARSDHADLLKPTGCHKPDCCHPGLLNTLEETNLQEAADPNNGPFDRERDAQPDQFDSQSCLSGLQRARYNNRQDSPFGLERAGYEGPDYCQSGPSTLETTEFQEAADPKNGPFDRERDAQPDQFDSQSCLSGLQRARYANRQDSPFGLEPAGYEGLDYCQSGPSTLETPESQEAADLEHGPFDQEPGAPNDHADPQPGPSGLDLSDEEDFLFADFSSQGESDEDEDLAVAAPYPVNPANGIQFEPFGSRPTPNWSFTSRYQVVPNWLLGSGRTGRIFAAIRLSDGERVAVKCVAKDKYKSQRSPGFRTPVPQEVAMMLELQRHPPLCSRMIHMHEWFEFPDGYIVVYEMLSHPWMRLDKFLEKHHDRISERMIRDLFRQLVLATKYCWEHRVYHLFSYQENIMVNIKTMKLKLCGFGGGRLAPVSSREPHLIDPEPDSRPDKMLIPLMALRSVLNFMVIYNETHTDGELVVSDECRELCRHLAVYRFHDAFDRILRHPWMAQDEWSYAGSQVPRLAL